MAGLVFTATIQIIGINPYILVSKGRAGRLKPGWRRPLPVTVRINGKPDVAWHINMVPTGNGNFYLYLHESVRRSSATQVGDVVKVEIDFDAEYKAGPSTPPDDLANLLESSPIIELNWAKLSPSRQKEVVRYMLNLKTEEARQRNLEKVEAALSGKPIQFMGRGWRNGH